MYIVAGAPAAIFGVEWDGTAAANAMTLTVTSGGSTVQTVTVDAGDAYKYSATAHSNAGGWTKFYGAVSAE